MWGMKLLKLSAWDVAYAIDMAIACLITYWVMIFLLPRLVGWHSTSGAMGDDFHRLRVQRHARSQSVRGNFATDCDICRLRFVSDLSLSISRDGDWDGGADRDRRAVDDYHWPPRRDRSNSNNDRRHYGRCRE